MVHKIYLNLSIVIVLLSILFSSQVHDSLNYLQKANDMLNIVKQSSNIHSAYGLVNMLDEIIKCLVKCQSRLVLPSQLALQALVGSGFMVRSVLLVIVLLFYSQMRVIVNYFVFSTKV